MRTFILCSGADGKEDALKRLADVVKQRQPDAVLFAGGILDASAMPDAPDMPAEILQRRRDDVRFLERFFETVGKLKTFTAIIPGPGDTPFRAFCYVSTHAEGDFSNVYVVHGRLAVDRDVVVSGIGGELTSAEDTGEAVLRTSRAAAVYFLRPFQMADQSQKILLLGVVPTGALGGESGNRLASEFIDSYHPKLCAVAGATERRGTERIAKTTTVNPGRLADRSAAWVDWNRSVEDQVELLDL
jgi:Icc-related predicted phosphoesterase